MIYRRDLEGGKKVLRREHPSTLASVNNLGYMLSKQGKYISKLPDLYQSLKQ